MNFFEYLSGERKSRELISKVPNDIIKKCRYIVDTLEVNHILITLNLEIVNIKKDYSDLQKDLINLVKQKRAQTESMVNILSKDINDYDNLIEKFKNDKDVDTTGYMGFLEKHRNESKGEHDYLSLLLNKQIEWLAENK